MKQFAIILTLCLLFGMSVTGYAQSSPVFYEDYGIWFDKETGTVTGVEEGLTELELPYKLGGKKVEKIGEKAFFECKTLQSVTFSESVKEIEALAFAGCTELSEIVFAEGLEQIGSEAFAQCSKLTEITLPSSVTKVKEYAFSYCEGLSEITVSERNKEYSSVDGVLFNKNLTTLVQYPCGKKEREYSVPDTVTAIGKGAFSYCSGLTELLLPQGVTFIGEYAFFNCDSLTEITLPHSVSQIGKEAFGWCDSLKKAVLPESLSKIEYGLFWYAKSLEEIVIPDSVTAIGDDAFASCESLKQIVFSEGLKTVGEESFYNCIGISELNLPKSLQQVGKKAFGNTGVFRVTVKNGATKLSEDAFEGCGELQFFTPEHSAVQEYALSRGDQWEKIVTVTYLGRNISFDQPPVTRFDRTLVPVRAIFEAMGATVDWEEETMTVTAVRNDRVLKLQIDNKTITVNGEAVELDVPAQQINDRTLVPVRAVADGLNCDVYWDEATQTVSIWEKEE